MSANSKDRSSVILINPKARTENYKRSAHADFATGSELKSREFSGWRANKLTDFMELWVAGEVVKEVPAIVHQTDPLALDKAFREYFQLD